MKKSLLIKMKKIFGVVLMLIGLSSYSQTENTVTTEINKEIKNPLTKKGQVFIFYGWNRAAFTNSDIHFSGNGYDFQLDNVVAHDRPTKFGLVYFDPSWFTVTSTISGWVILSKITWRSFWESTT